LPSIVRLRSAMIALLIWFDRLRRR
jgi:hypothetical protein